MGVRRVVYASLIAAGLVLHATHLRAQGEPDNVITDAITVTPNDNLLHITADTADTFCAVIQPLDKSNKPAAAVSAYCNPTDKNFLKTLEANRGAYARALASDALTFKNAVGTTNAKYQDLKRRTNLQLIDDLADTRNSQDINVKITAALKLANSDRELDIPRDQEINAAAENYNKADAVALTAYQMQDKAARAALFTRLFPQGVDLIRLPDDRQSDASAKFTISSTAQVDGLCAILAAGPPRPTFNDVAALCSKDDPTFRRDARLITENFQNTVERDASAAEATHETAQKQYDAQRLANEQKQNAASNDPNADFGLAIIMRGQADKAAMQQLTVSNTGADDFRAASDALAARLRDTQNVTAWANLFGRSFPNGIPMTLMVLSK